MHLPKATRRRIVYATATVLVTGGLVYSWKHSQPAQPSVAAAVVPGGQRLDINQAPSKQAPAASAQKAGKRGAVPREKVETYKVQEGDAVEAIAARFGLKADTILWANNLDSEDLLQIDQELRIPAMDGLVYEIVPGDTLWDIARDYGADEDKIIEANPELDPAAIQPGQVVVIPGGQPARRGTVASRGSGGTASRGSSRKFSTWPVWGTLTDSFGWRIHPVYGGSSFHDGMDISVGSGTPLVSVAGGTVTMAQRYGGYGLAVRIDHGGGLSTQYAHMSQIDVSVGEEVGAGEHIGYSGNTGVSTGPHLHFMVMVDGSPSDPMSYLP